MIQAVYDTLSPTATIAERMWTYLRMR